MTGPGDRAGALTAAREQVLAEAEDLRRLADALDDGLAAALDVVGAASGRVVTTAVGASGALASRLAQVLCLCDVPAVHLDANQVLHGSSGAVGAGDVVIALSKGGRTTEVTECVRLLRSRGAVTVAVTEGAGSALTAAADHAVVLPPSEADPAGRVSMGSAVAMAAWGDALAVALMELRGTDGTDVASRHPKGLVGELAQEEER